MIGRVSRCTWALAFFLAASLGATAQEESVPDIQVLPPAGFELLNEPQSYSVDVVFGDEVMGQTLVIAKPGEVTLQDPGAVLALLPAVREGARAQVIEALSSALPSNAGLSCFPRANEGCGRLDPAVAGVIFDDAYLRLSVFINPLYLAIDPSALARRDLPPPSAKGLAFYNPLSLFYVGTTGENSSQDINAFSDSYLTQGQASLHVATSYVSDPSGDSEGEDFALEDASFLYVRPGWLYRAGLDRSASIDLIGSGRFLGAGIETTTATRLDLESAQGSNLVVFLSSRSTVDLLVDGRTISRRQYPAGKIALDTEGLPDGAYDLTIRIRDEGGAVTEETRFYARTANVPLRDAPTYVLQAGILVKDERALLPVITDRPLLRAGAAYRIADELALGTDILATSDLVIGSANFDLFTSFGIFTGSLLGTSQEDYGAGLAFHGSLSDFSYSLSGQLFERAQGTGGSGDEIADDLLGQSFKQASLTLSYPLAENLDLSFQGYWREEAGGVATYSYGPSLIWRLYHGDGLQIALHGSLTQSEKETVAQLQFHFYFDAGPGTGWSASATAGTLGSFNRTAGTLYDRTYSPFASAQAQWSDGALLADDLRLYGGAGYDTQRTTSVYIGGEHKSQWAGLSAEAHQSRLPDQDTTTLLQAGLVTALAIDGQGVALGGAEGGQAAIVIDLSSGDEGALYDVLVDGQKRISLQGSAKAVLPLQPYRTYRISLAPRGGAAVQGELLDQTVTLYPGNSVTLSWETYRVLAIFGRLLDESGKPLGPARIDGNIGIAFADESGFFQLEVKDTAPLVVTTASSSCRVDLAGSNIDLSGQVEYLNVGNLICR